MQLSFVFSTDRAHNGTMRPDPWETLDDVARTEVVGALAKLMVKMADTEEPSDER